MVLQMRTSLALALVLVFLTLSVWHVYWAAGGRYGKPAAVPSAQDRGVFAPSTLAMLLVAVGLLACAGLVAATAGFIDTPVPGHALGSLSITLAAALMMRAIGDFKLVGFFKPAHDSAFARRDTLLYSPLCLALALAVGTLTILSRP
jgi:hypothetical protein